MRNAALLTLVIAALVAGGCGGSDESDDAAERPAAATTEPAPTQPSTTDEQPAPPAGKGTTIKLADSQFGKILFDRRGQAIYLFDKEKSDRSACYGECAEAWPPVLTKGRPQAADGIDRALLGTTKRRDGTTQVTYNGHPLYHYAHEGPNEVKCHNVTGFGGLWLVLDEKGDALD